MIQSPKLVIIRDRKWLDHLHGERCVISGMLGTDRETIDPMHIGAYRGMKRSDDEVLPVAHHLHLSAHQAGEISMFRREAPDTLLRAALRALAREMYREWKDGP